MPVNRGTVEQGNAVQPMRQTFKSGILAQYDNDLDNLSVSWGRESKAVYRVEILLGGDHCGEENARVSPSTIWQQYTRCPYNKPCRIFRCV